MELGPKSHEATPDQVEAMEIEVTRVRVTDRECPRYIKYVHM